MSTATLRKRLKETIDSLSGPQLQATGEFIAFVQSRKIDAATAELLGIPGFRASYAGGQRDIAAGRTRNWRQVRRATGG
jgi:hypothetical protein